MQYVTKQHIAQANTDGRQQLFDRRSPNCVKPGDVMLVETLNSTKDTSTSTFMGVCIAIRRKGIDTNFTLRNIVIRVGVEQRFSLYSPLVKSVSVIPTTTEHQFRRAKLFYLREQPGRVFNQLQTLWKRRQAEKK
ncbi:50S ribosomal protein L19 [Spinellus fusiger]|nr:50S ribosomal protein L19 [Spinellus fusiger]